MHPEAVTKNIITGARSSRCARNRSVVSASARRAAAVSVNPPNQPYGLANKPRRDLLRAQRELLAPMMIFFCDCLRMHPQRFEASRSISTKKRNPIAGEESSLLRRGSVVSASARRAAAVSVNPRNQPYGLANKPRRTPAATTPAVSKRKVVSPSETGSQPCFSTMSNRS